MQRRKRKLRNSESEATLIVEPIIRLVIVGVQPAIVVTIHVEQVRIAIGMCEASSFSLPIDHSQGCILSGIFNALILRTKCLIF